MTNSKKDSELEEILTNLRLGGKPKDAWTTENDIEKIVGAVVAIKSRYITKEESDRRVLEARYQGAKDFNDSLVTRLKPAGMSFETYQVDSLSDAIQATMAEFRELLNGDKDVVH